MSAVPEAMPRKAWRIALRRALAWVIDVVIVTLIVSLAFGDLVFDAAPGQIFLIGAASALIGALYFFIFTASFDRTPGLAIAKGSVRSSTMGRVACSAVFGTMLLPFGLLVLIAEAFFDVFGSLDAEVIV